MTQEEFDNIVGSRLEAIKQTLLVKGKEYIRNNDPLHNFNRAANISGITPTRALHGFMMKHMVSYLDILDDIDKGIIHSDELINEKLGDIIVYMILQEANIKNLKQL